ncbi:restriction endonuclease [Micromonospora saelicesensis]|uniref:restriction endonuclease n=1 Tax=Micromonospora saelicesensis TaxID=285676 RepID=UPI003D93A0A8
MSEFERARKQQERETERAKRVAAANAKEQKRLQRQRYVDERKARAQRISESLLASVGELETFLLRGLDAVAKSSISQLRRVAVIPPLQLETLHAPGPAPAWEGFAPPAPSFWRRSFAAAAITRELEEAKLAFLSASSTHARLEAEHARLLDQKRAEYRSLVEREEAAVERHNASLNRLWEQVIRRQKAAVETYLLSMMSIVPLPDSFPREMQIAFDPTNEHVVLEVELPRPECVPAKSAARYVLSKDEIFEVARPAKEMAALYRASVAQLSLLSLAAIFKFDPAVKQISLNGRVRHVSPATGHEERPHIVSVVVSRDQFEPIVLERVNPNECLRHLRALVSPHPFELEAVEPLVSFDRSRLAFIDGLEVVSSLDARPDLMAMSPTEFEHLIRQLLEADPSIERVESLTTRQSNDGGVDGVVYINQPFGRSMTVVQVKQYARSRTLGPDHIRELIGSMHEAKAGNGLLVTTSTFSPIARTNAADFGRISLIDGSNLVFMVKRLLGKDVLVGDRRR